MRRRVLMLIAVCILGIAAAGAALLVACGSGGSDAVPSEAIPTKFLYAGNRYIYVGIVARQDKDANTPSNVICIGSISFLGANHGVYLIKGIDENQAIALKIVRGGGYTYYKYERLYGQEEPADFVYQDRDYSGTGEIVATQRVSSTAGELEAVSYLSSVIYQDATYDVYSIQGVDENQAIALRIVKAGTKVGFYYFYFKYERR